MNEVRLAGRTDRVHAAFLREMVPLSSITGAAGSHHVGPLIVSTARERDQMIPGETLAMTQIRLGSMAVLAAVAISSEEECVGDLATKAAGNVDEFDESYDCRFGQRQTFASNAVASVSLDDLGFALDHQTEGAPDRYHRQRFKGGVQRQTPQGTSPEMRWDGDEIHAGYLERTGRRAAGFFIANVA
jgi:hypothetical protein